MENWRGARPVNCPVDAFVLLLADELDDRGMRRYTYSTAPGVTVTLSVRPSAGTLPPDDPAVLAEVARIEEARRGYTGDDH